jgi:hypothetical protein
MGLHNWGRVRVLFLNETDKTEVPTNLIQLEKLSVREEPVHTVRSAEL